MLLQNTSKALRLLDDMILPQKKKKKKLVTHYCYNTNQTGTKGCTGTGNETLPWVCLELGGRDLPNTTVPITGAFINAPNCNLYTFVSITSGATATSDATGSTWTLNGTYTVTYSDGTNTCCTMIVSGTWNDGCALC